MATILANINFEYIFWENWNTYMHNTNTQLCDQYLKINAGSGWGGPKGRSPLPVEGVAWKRPSSPKVSTTANNVKCMSSVSHAPCGWHKRFENSWYIWWLWSYERSFCWYDFAMNTCPSGKCHNGPSTLVAGGCPGGGPLMCHLTKVAEALTQS